MTLAARVTQIETKLVLTLKEPQHANFKERLQKYTAQIGSQGKKPFDQLIHKDLVTLIKDGLPHIFNKDNIEKKDKKDKKDKKEKGDKKDKKEKKDKAEAEDPMTLFAAKGSSAAEKASKKQKEKKSEKGNAKKSKEGCDKGGA